MFVAGVCGERDLNASYTAWGHSMLVNPWGKVLVQAEHDQTILYADIGTFIIIVYVYLLS